MKREHDLVRQRKAYESLRDVVGAMKSLSAHHFRVARSSLAAARQYRDDLEDMLGHISLPTSPRPKEPTGILLVGSDLGLCGDYNSRILEAAFDEAGRHSSVRLYCIGQRAHRQLLRLGHPAVRAYSMPAAVSGISLLLLQVAADLMSDYRDDQIGQLVLITSRFEGIGRFSTMPTTVLPIIPRSKPTATWHSDYDSPEHLASVALREYLYVILYELLLEALSSEHGNRLLATERAEEWLDDRRDRTGRMLAAVRRESATQEVLDVASGARQQHADDSHAH